MSATKEQIDEARAGLIDFAQKHEDHYLADYIPVVVNALTAAERERDEAVARADRLERAIREAPETIQAMINEHVKHG